MIALMLVILLIVGVFGIALLIAGLRNIGTYRRMTKDDYAILNEQAKQIVKQQQEDILQGKEHKRKTYNHCPPPCMGF